MKEPAATWTHFVMFLGGIAGLVLLVLKARQSPSALVTALIFGTSIVTLYGASSIYHWVRSTPRTELTLRKIDHISIYYLIAGTYTPVLYFGLTGAWRWVMLSIVWALAVTGAILKLWFVKAPRVLTTTFYLALGWFALVPFAKLLQSLVTPAVILMIAGGVAYTIGGIIYATKKFDIWPGKFGFHEVFHVFVGLGTVLHFIMIYQFVLPS